MCLKDAFSLPVKKKKLPWSLKLPKYEYWVQKRQQGQMILFYTVEILDVHWMFSDLGSNPTQVILGKKVCSDFSIRIYVIFDDMIKSLHFYINRNYPTEIININVPCKSHM